MIEHKFRDVIERDMDVLILEEFTCSNNFSKIFLDKIGLDNAHLLLTWQSKTDAELGESDMTVIFDCRGKKVALLIEDKIDAIAMPEQPTRYILRGNKGLADNEYDSYYVFIVAPQQYLDNNDKASEYPYKVSYEEIKEYFEKLNDTRSSFKLAQINFAIDKQKEGYQVIKNELVTDFWNKFIEYKNKHFPELNLAVHSEVKPTNGVWPHFRTNKNNYFIYYKSNKGYVDLTYNGQANNIDNIKKFLIKVIGNYYKEGLDIVKTGKSCAIRLKVPIVDFSKPFEGQEEFVKLSLLATKKLYALSNILEREGIFIMFETNFQ